MALIQEYNKLYEQNSIIKKIYVNGNRVWPIKFIGYSEPFYVENITNNTETLSITKSNSSAPTITIQYSTNGNLWYTLGSTSTTALTKTLAPGDKVYLRCNANGWAYNDPSEGFYNSIRGVSKIGGNTMSLLYGNQFTGQETEFPSNNIQVFRSLFGQNINLVDAESLLLPARTMTSRCYRFMFDSCTSLTKAPKVLPATTLSNQCYESMFRSCSSLTTAPTLPATTLTDRSYYTMFRYCSSLNNITCLASTLSGTTPLSNWVDGVAASGTFTKAAGVTWPTDTSGIPSGWAVVEV